MIKRSTKQNKRAKSSKRRKKEDKMGLQSRSALTNANALILGDVDGRTALPRRYRDVRDQILLDLGGTDSVPAIKHGVVEQAAALIVMAEEQVGFKLSSEEIIKNGKSTGLKCYDHKIHMNLIKQLVPVARTLGIRRVPKSVSHADTVVDLEDYIDGRRERLSGRKRNDD